MLSPKSLAFSHYHIGSHDRACTNFQSATFFPKRSFQSRANRLRTIPDPEFPGEDESLYFVMVEFNMDDIRELKRVTQLEMQGTLDADGVKAFVDAL
jgi:hypothetical protein